MLAARQNGAVTPLDEFQAQRGRLFGIAYRMLGSATEAEDVLQDAWLRWQAADRERVADAPAYLARTVTNLCLTALDSARARREVYVGPWLPEPVLTGPDVQDDAERADSVSIALLLLLERLTPAERAAYVLREAFGYSHREVAGLLDTTEQNARQLLSRARARVDAPPRREADPEQWRELVTRFIAAARDGDLPALESMLSSDVVSWSDGGGVVGAARRAVAGRDQVARFIIGVFEKFTDGLVPAFAVANGEPVLLAFAGEALRAAWFVETDGATIEGLRMVLNPEKLAYAQGQLSRIGGLPGPS